MTPTIEQMELDAAMAKRAEELGRDKCLAVGCMVLIVPELNRDGFCQYHREKRRREGR